MSVGIVKDDFYGKHSTSWTGEWLDACREVGLEYELVNWRRHDLLEKLFQHHIVLWHFSNYSSSEMKFARSIIYALEKAGCLVFPGFKDVWHFDDKVGQALLLRAIDAPTPRNYVFFSLSDFDSWLSTAAQFPIVAKLRTGSGSQNVQLLTSHQEAQSYARKMFGKGLSTSPDPFFKITSNIRSSHTLSEMLKRAKRAPEFFFNLRQSLSLPREQGYVYLQEFIKGAKYDIKIIVIKDKIGFIGRYVRGSDFRASGGGDIFYDKSIMNQTIIETAFHVADTLGTNCIGMDLVVCPLTKKPYIVEISYGFSHSALLAAGGYYNRAGNWCPEPLNAPREILFNLLDTFKGQSA